jgi:hypothetical protein
MNSRQMASTSQDDTEHIQIAFQCSSKRSVPHVSRQLQILKSIVHDVVDRRLKLCAYMLPLVQHIQPCDKPQRVNFVMFMLEQLTAGDSSVTAFLIGRHL